MKVEMSKDKRKMSITEIDVKEEAKVSSTGKTKTYVYETITASFKGEVVKIKVTMYVPIADEAQIHEL